MLAYEDDPGRRESRAFDRQPSAGSQLRRAADRALRIVELPYPARRSMMNGERLPASYANFYIANGVVHRADVQRPERSRRAGHAGRAVPDRQVVGIHAVDLVWGLGTLHCLTQQQPAGTA